MVWNCEKLKPIVEEYMSKLNDKKFTIYLDIPT